MNARKKTTILIIAVLMMALLTDCGIIGSLEKEAAEDEDARNTQSETRNTEIEMIALSGEDEKEQKSDGEIIRDMVDECINGTLISASCGWLHYQTLEQKFADMKDNNIIDSPDEISVHMTDDNIAFITNILRSTEYVVLSKEAQINTGFLITLEYDTGCRYEIRLSDRAVYMNISRNGEHVYYAKVLNFVLYEYIFRFADKNISGFDTDVLSDIESAKIYYVKEEDKANFYKSGKITEIEITDSETIEKILAAFDEGLDRQGTYRFDDGSDMVFYTEDGEEYYGKIIFPVDEESTDYTIIMQGYFWYECKGLYEVLAEIDRE